MRSSPLRYKILPNPDVATDTKFEISALVKHYSRARSTRARLRGQKHLKANVGCGRKSAAGWVNLDLLKSPEVDCWDCRRGLPFDDDSVSIIFSEHMFEHLSRPQSSDAFLSECLRCLEPGGVLRLIVPDGGLYLRAYASGSWEPLIEARRLQPQNGAYLDGMMFPVHIYRTPMELINVVFRQGSEHKYAYDSETLIMDLERAGFSRVVEQSFGETLSEHVPLDSPDRASESLYVDAVK